MGVVGEYIETEYHLHVCGSEDYLKFNAPNDGQALEYAQQWMIRENYHDGYLVRVDYYRHRIFGRTRTTMTIGTW